jgi:uncharacterized protein (TIGR02453 family)
MSVQLHPDTLTFLKELKHNNNKEWFDKNRLRYEEIRKVYIHFIEELILELSKFHSPVASITAKECIFRINRDIRFSKNKAPYKTNLASFIAPGGKKSERPGFYFHIEPNGETYIGAGIYKPQPLILQAIRQEIDYNAKEFLSIVQNRAFQKELKQLFEDRVRTVPKGYDKSNPMIEWLKYRSYFAGCNIRDEYALNSRFFTRCIKLYKTALPLVQFLERCYD